MADDDSLSQEDIDSLLGLGENQEGGGDEGADELNLDSLLTDDEPVSASQGSSGGIDQETLDALAGMTEGRGSTGSATQTASRSRSSRGDGDKDNMNLLLDVMVRFTVELGRSRMLIKDVMLLGEGSVVELDKMVGDEVDILVNDRLFGRGRLVIVDEDFGVQITHIIDPLARFRNL